MMCELLSLEKILSIQWLRIQWLKIQLIQWLRMCELLSLEEILREGVIPPVQQGGGELQEAARTGETQVGWNIFKVNFFRRFGTKWRYQLCCWICKHSTPIALLSLWPLHPVWLICNIYGYFWDLFLIFFLGESSSTLLFYKLFYVFNTSTSKLYCDVSESNYKGKNA